MTLPDFLVIGAQRSGTTWMHTLLGSHPDIWLPTRRKEVEFFKTYYDKGLDWYRDFFPEEGHPYRAVGEVSPGYLISPDAPERIHRAIPDCRLVAILRNPVDRLYSSYGLALSNGQQVPFDDWLHRPALRAGEYATGLERYLSFFPRERIHLVIFEEATRDAEGPIGRLADFLGVPLEGFESAWFNRKVHASRRPAFPRLWRAAKTVSRKLHRWDMDGVVNVAKRLGARRLFGDRGRPAGLAPARRAELFEHYAPQVDRLEQLFDLDLSAWRASCQNQAA